MGISLLRRTAAISLALLASACGGGGTTSVVTTPTATTPTTPTTPSIPYPAGLTETTMMVGGIERRFLVHVPTGLTQAKAIIVVLHGGGGSGSQASSFVGSPQAVFRTVADREGLVAIYPTARSGNWNDCRADAPGIGTDDDVAFFDAMLSRLQTELNVDARRIFMSGHSNGAMMSMRYALERPERIAAIGVGSGNLAASPKPGRCTTGAVTPVPALMTHGALDSVVPYGGGCVAQDLTIGCPQGTVISAEATRDRWRTFNGVTNASPTVSRVDLVANDGGAAVQSRYSGTTPVEWWRLEGAGHDLPSRTIFTDRLISGVQNRDVEFAEISWAFFAARLP